MLVVLLNGKKLMQTTSKRSKNIFFYIQKNDVDLNKLQNGDIIFFIKPEKRRIIYEIVGHLGFVEINPT